eukprot:scaffold201926_cov32-Tisochrysis_lutea.AAC.2
MIRALALSAPTTDRPLDQPRLMDWAVGGRGPAQHMVSLIAASQGNGEAAHNISCAHAIKKPECRARINV